MSKLPVKFPQGTRAQLDYAQVIADNHRKLDDNGRAVCMARIQQENPRLAKLVADQLRRAPTQEEGK